MAFIRIEDPDENIWKTNPSLKLISDFEDFKEKEGEDRSSSILKAIFYIWDPKSELRDSGVSESQLIEDVTKNLINDPDFNWDDYDHIKTLYQETNITKIEGLLLRYEKEIHDLNTILEDWKWNKKEIKDRAAAVSQYKVLFDEYVEVKDKVKMETDELSEMYGGYQKSMLEDFGKD